MMPTKKWPNTSKKSQRKATRLGSGSQSRTALDFEELREAGWTITSGERLSSSGVKVYFRCINPVAVKGTNEVEQRLKHEGTFETFKTTRESDFVRASECQHPSSSC